MTCNYPKDKGIWTELKKDDPNASIEICESCNGSGLLDRPSDKFVQCGNCRGEGFFKNGCLVTDLRELTDENWKEINDIHQDRAKKSLGT